MTQHIRGANRLHGLNNIRANLFNRLTLDCVNQTFKQIINIANQGLRHPAVINSTVLLSRQGRTVVNSNRRDRDITVILLGGMTFGQASLVQLVKSIVSVRVVHLRGLSAKGLLSQEKTPKVRLAMDFITRGPSWRGQCVRAATRYGQ